MYIAYNGHNDSNNKFIFIQQDLGYHSGHLGTLPDDPPSQPTLAVSTTIVLLNYNFIFTCVDTHGNT